MNYDHTKLYIDGRWEEPVGAELGRHQAALHPAEAPAATAATGVPRQRASRCWTALRRPAREQTPSRSPRESRFPEASVDQNLDRAEVLAATIGDDGRRADLVDVSQGIGWPDPIGR